MAKILEKIRYFGRWGKTVNGVMERIPADGWEEALHSGKTPRPASDGMMVMG